MTTDELSAELQRRGLKHAIPMINDAKRGHGHVRKQRVTARCGGPKCCRICALEQVLVAMKVIAA